MKICYIANAASSHTVKWVDYLVSVGHEVHVISHGNAEIPGAKVYYMDYSIRNFFSASSKVHKLIKDINPDVVHAHTANTCGLYGVTMKGYKVIVSAWGSDILVAPKTSLIMKKIIQYVIKKAYFITSDSINMTEKIIEFGAKKEKCFTFPMGVEEDLLNYKSKYNLEDNVLNILSNRRLEKMYNVDIIIKGFKRALEENKNLHLTVAADGTEIANLKQLAKELNLEANLKFTGRYTHEELCNMLEENEVFISIPDSDSTSVSLLEAMCCGMFPVLCDLPGNREWVNHGDNGYILKEITEEQVKEAILWCAANKNFMKSVSEKNINIIKERALWKENAKIVEELYRKACKN